MELEFAGGNQTPDVTAPETTHDIVGEAQNHWYSGPVTVNLKASDSESEVAATYYSINNGDVQTGTSIDILEEGQHVIHYWSKDEFGNVEEKKEVGINIDLTAPVINFSVGDGVVYGIDEVVTISCNGEDVLSGIATSTCKEISEPAYQLGIGDHTFEAEGVDVAGNKTTASITITVTVNFESLAALTESFLNDNGNEEKTVSYLSKLVAAKAAEERGNTKVRDGQLHAFMNHVKAQANKQITEEQAEYLISFAGELMK
ncbi:OmpL47-type beta-barrel domain-containing protein [Neobacillus sp. NPDC058068]|uniref:OmpL47-type beta-barrel domain-containing protein n=1 Tax=Neobacillus sp. NPDC058068 TaxID=3346325 RepID=UPI0036DDDA59